MKLQKIDHICFAVRDLEAARKRYEGDLGLEPDVIYTSEEEKIHVARYYIGEVALELMEPTEPDSDVGRFLEKRGEGFFLISYRVEDVDEGLAELKGRGVQTIDHKPRELGGILTEILDGEFDRDKGAK